MENQPLEKSQNNNGAREGHSNTIKEGSNKEQKTIQT